MTLAVGNHVAFYSSPDLKEWTHESDFGKDGRGAWWRLGMPGPVRDYRRQERATQVVLFVSVEPRRHPMAARARNISSAASTGGNSRQMPRHLKQRGGWTTEPTITPDSTWSGITPGGSATLYRLDEQLGVCESRADATLAECHDGAARPDSRENARGNRIALAAGGGARSSSHGPQDRRSKDGAELIRS